jgi:hypothetical protein
MCVAFRGERVGAPCQRVGMVFDRPEALESVSCLLECGQRRIELP